MQNIEYVNRKSAIPFFLHLNNNTDLQKNNISMFKSNDIRTKECNLTPTTKERLADSIATYLKKINIKSVVICRDARLYVPQLAEIIQEKILDCGIDVKLDPVPVSSCLFYFTCMKNKTSAGLMFTASHNPGEYTGIKLLAPGLIPISMNGGPEGGLATIRDLYEKGAKAEKSAKRGRLYVVNEMDAYIDYSMKLAGVAEGSLKGLNLMLEFFNGSAGFEQAMAFQKAGANVTCRHIIPNGLFPCGDPNPIIKSSIEPTQKAMKNGKFDLGLCFDGDGDRLDVMDCNGNQIVPSRNLSIVAPHIKNEIFNGSKTDVYLDPKALPTSLIDIAKTGITPHSIRTGHSFIKAKLMENFKKGYFAAVEESAHYYMLFPYDLNKITNKLSDYAVTESTMFYALLTARCCKENPKLYKPAEKETVFREREWGINAEKKPQVMEFIKRDINSLMLKKGATIISTMEDGSDLETSLLRFNLPEVFTKDSDLEGKNWFQIIARISRSEDALLRLEISSNSKKTCRDLKKDIDAVVSKYL